MSRATITTYFQTPTGRFVHNVGVILLVFVLTSMGMDVFAENNQAYTSGNPFTHYLWKATHRQEIQELGKEVEYAQARIYIFKRMKGNPATWGWEDKDHYDRIYAEQQERVAHYNRLVERYNAGQDPSETGVAPKQYPSDFMPYAKR